MSDDEPFLYFMESTIDNLDKLDEEYQILITDFQRTCQNAVDSGASHTLKKLFDDFGKTYTILPALWSAFGKYAEINTYKK